MCCAVLYSTSLCCTVLCCAVLHCPSQVLWFMNVDEREISYDQKVEAILHFLFELWLHHVTWVLNSKKSILNVNVSVKVNYQDSSCPQMEKVQITSWNISNFWPVQVMQSFDSEFSIYHQILLSHSRTICRIEVLVPI